MVGILTVSALNDNLKARSSLNRLLCPSVCSFVCPYVHMNFRMSDMKYSKLLHLVNLNQIYNYYEWVINKIWLFEADTLSPSLATSVFWMLEHLNNLHLSSLLLNTLTFQVSPVPSHLKRASPQPQCIFDLFRGPLILKGELTTFFLANWMSAN